MNLINVLIESKELKRTIVKLSIEHKIPFRYICAEAKVEYGLFMRSYINAVDSSGYEITESQFRIILNVLGIKIRYQFIIDEEVDMAERSKKIMLKYEKIHAKELKNGKEKTGTSNA